MHIVIGALLAVGGAVLWWARRNPEDALHIAQNAVTVAQNAPRKIAFRRQYNQHPVDGIDDSRLVVSALGHAFIALDDLPTREARKQLEAVLRKTYRLSEEDAVEMQSLSVWLIEQCGGAQASISRLGRRLHKINGKNAWDDLRKVFESAASQELSVRQLDALEDLKLALRIR